MTRVQELAPPPHSEAPSETVAADVSVPLVASVHSSLAVHGLHVFQPLPFPNAQASAEQFISHSKCVSAGSSPACRPPNKDGRLRAVCSCFQLAGVPDE